MAKEPDNETQANEDSIPLEELVAPLIQDFKEWYHRFEMADGKQDGRWKLPTRDELNASAKEIVSKWDDNGDGTITREEFLKNDVWILNENSAARIVQMINDHAFSIVQTIDALDGVPQAGSRNPNHWPPLDARHDGYVRLPSDKKLRWLANHLLNAFDEDKDGALNESEIEELQEMIGAADETITGEMLEGASSNEEPSSTFPMLKQALNERLR